SCCMDTCIYMLQDEFIFCLQEIDNISLQALFFFSLYHEHRILYSFPTRRSSDLSSVFDIYPHGKNTRNDNKSQYNKSLETYTGGDRKSTRLNSSHVSISYAVFCLKKKK